MCAASTSPLSSLKAKGFDVKFVSHAEAILVHDFPEAIAELEAILSSLELPINEIIGSGGGETKFTQRLRRSLSAAGWPKAVFTVAKTVNGKTRESISHEIDHVRERDNGTIALEIEWNNKDPFFDRDLENFQRLHAEGAISVGILLTRGESLQDSMQPFVQRFIDEHGIKSYDDLIAVGYEPTSKQRKAVEKQVTRLKKPLTFRDAWSNNFVKNKYGTATTHWEKLDTRIKRGVGNPCPLLLIGLPAEMVTFEAKTIEMLSDEPSAEEADDAEAAVT